MISESKRNLQVGSNVRFKTESTWEYGTIAVINSNQSCEIIDKNLNDFSVLSSNIRPLSNFENDEFEIKDLKLDHFLDYCKELFVCGDCLVAEKLYLKVLNSIVSPIKVGSNVLVCCKNDASSFKAGIVANISESGGVMHIDVIYDDEVGGVDEENDILAERFTKTIQFSRESSKDLGQNTITHIKVMLNIAKCHLKLKSFHKVIKYASIALALGKYYLQHEKSVERRKIMINFCGNALQIRAKAYLSTGNHRSAVRDCKVVKRSDDIDTKIVKAVEKLATEIEHDEKEKRKKDRKLANEIGKWVQKSLNSK